MIDKIIKDFFEKHDFLIEENQQNKFIIALSGGGDSLALAKACGELQKQSQNIKFICAIIDHGIAQNSNEIAQNALIQANNLGLDGKIIVNKIKILPPIQENARNIRYNLLTEFAFENNAKAILLGHNYDDQIETIAFRLLRKTGLMGLGAMDEIKLIINFSKPALILRPILSVKRQALRQYLIDNKIKYFDDPANENTKFSRVNIRKKIKQLNNESINAKLEKISLYARIIKKYFNDWAYDFIVKNMIFENAAYHIEISKLIELVPIYQNYILEIIIKCLGSDNFSPQNAKIETLRNRINNIDFNAATLGNVWIRKRKNIIIFAKAPQRKSQISNFNPNPTAQNLRLLASCNRIEGFLKL